jgi:GTP cyclohydrolase IIa
MREAHDSLSFFVGGDNVIAVCPDLGEADYREAIDHVAGAVDVELQVGVGRGETAGEAGMAAKHALERSRATGDPVHADWADAHPPD